MPKSFKQVKFRNIFGLSNVIDAVIDSWDEKSVCFGDRIYFTVVCTHAKCPIRFWYKNTRRTPFTLTGFYKVIIQQILNFISENFLAHLSRRLMGELIVYQSLRRPSVVCCPSVRPQFQTSSPLKPLGQLNSNFIWRLLRTWELKFVQLVLVT